MMVWSSVGSLSLFRGCLLLVDFYSNINMQKSEDSDVSLLELLRKPRIGPFAVFDTVGTVGLSILWNRWTRWGLPQSIIFMFVVGEVSHLASATQTPGTEILKHGTNQA